MTSDLKSRIESGDLRFLDGLVLLGTIASQRWFGGKSKDVLDARVLVKLGDSGNRHPLEPEHVPERRIALEPAARAQAMTP